MPATIKEMTYINFDQAKRERLRKAHNKAVEEYKSAFEFEGNQFLTTYAGYLLEYLDMKMGKRP